MNKYSSYKDSEVDWIGEVPTQWSVSRVKKYFKERNEKVSDLEYDPLSVTKNGIVPQLDNVSKSDNHNDRKRVSKNDFVINSRSDRKGSSGMSEYNGSVSLINIVLRPISINPKYSEFLFKSKSFIEEFFRNGKGIHWDLWSTRYSELQNIKIPYPSIKEQQQIVSFLDDKTQKIDTLLQQKEKKIELLKEKRTSLINHVVTKGLDPNVEMKDSEVEWIGEIPRDWVCGKLKYLSEIISKGTTPSTVGREVLDEGSIFYIKVENIKERTVEIPPINYIDEETDRILKRSSLIENDILVVITGSTTGKVVILPKELSPSNTNQGISFIRLKNKSNENVKYTWFWLSSEIIQELIKITYTQSTQPNLSMEDLGNFYIPIPPLEEQQQIVEYLDEKTEEIDTLIQLEQKKIDTLKEYRQSLISEVVTGKIRVCEEDNSLSLNSQIV